MVPPSIRSFVMYRVDSKQGSLYMYNRIKNNLAINSCTGCCRIQLMVMPIDEECKLGKGNLQEPTVLDLRCTPTA